MHTFELTDRNGDVHRYACMPHDANDGEIVVLELLRLVPEPLAAFLGSFDGGLEDVERMLSGEVEGGLDLSGLGEALSGVLGKLDGPKLRRLILANTSRDGDRLSDRTAFGKAYQRNYGELARALVEVCRYNAFFPEFGTEPSKA